MPENEQLATSGRRYVCFTPEQQREFDHLAEKVKRYIVFLSQGLGKKAAYVAAGYKESANSNKGARVLESRYPIIRELVDALRGHNERMDAYKEGTPISQAIDKKAEGLLDTVPTVPMDLIGTEDRVEVEKFSVEQAARIKFYRGIVSGKIKNVKKTIRYDKDHNVIGYQVEETTDVATQMRARVELDKALGVNDMLTTVGQISVGSITINFVDASKQEEGNEIIIDGGNNDGAAE